MFSVKGVPTMLYRLRHEPRDWLAAAILLSAQLTLTVAGVEIGRQLGLLTEALGSALILAAVLSVLIAPHPVRASTSQEELLRSFERRFWGFKGSRSGQVLHYRSPLHRMPCLMGRPAR